MIKLHFKVITISLKKMATAENKFQKSIYQILISIKYLSTITLKKKKKK